MNLFAIVNKLVIKTNHFCRILLYKVILLKILSKQFQLILKKQILIKLN
jgi:hypothetical protein